MKKVIFGLLLLFMASANIKAQSPETQIKYWYYPSQNVYYNDVTGDYWFCDKNTARWSTAKQLMAPYAPVVETDTRYPVYYGPDIWKANANHKVKYKVKKDGTVKTKVKPNDR